MLPRRASDAPFLFQHTIVHEGDTLLVQVICTNFGLTRTMSLHDGTLYQGEDEQECLAQGPALASWLNR